MQSDLETTGKRTILPVGVFLGSRFAFEEIQTLDFEKLNANKHVVSGCVTQTSQCGEAFFLTAGVHQVTRGLGHEQHHTDSEDNSR